MNTLLKYKPGWMQLLIFGLLTIGINFIVSILAVFAVSNFYNISPAEFKAMDLTNPTLVSALKSLQVIISIAWFLVPSLIFAQMSDTNPLPYIGFKNPVPKIFLLLAIVVIVASFPMVAWLSEINQNMHLPKSFQATEKLIRDSEAQNNNLIRTFLDMKSPTDLAIMLFMLGVLPAIAEEVFFRGVLQRLLILLTKRPWIGTIFTAILFSALHGQFLGFFPRLVLGIVLGALYWYSGSLWPGILAHFINNAVQVIMVYYNPHFFDEKDQNLSVLMVTASTIIVAVIMWWMVKISQTRFAEVYDTDDDFHIGPRDQFIA
ncbi:MAG: CPBP family intramembrane glutamic endopeptidase [Chitinophagaceae bacterium]